MRITEFIGIPSCVETIRDKSGFIMTVGYLTYEDYRTQIMSDINKTSLLCSEVNQRGSLDGYWLSQSWGRMTERESIRIVCSIGKVYVMKDGEQLAVFSDTDNQNNYSVEKSFIYAENFVQSLMGEMYGKY